MLKSFISQYLDSEFTSAPVAADAPRVGAKEFMVAMIAATVCFVGAAAAIVKLAQSTVASAPVAETANWAMMLVGLSMIGLMAHRRHVGS